MTAAELELLARGEHRDPFSVLGPHFEHVCRSWLRHQAPDELLGDLPNRVGAGTVNDPSNRSTATEMLRGVARLMWHLRAGDRILLRDRGLIFRRKNSTR